MPSFALPILAVVVVIIVAVAVALYRSGVDKFQVERSQLEALQKDWHPPSELASCPQPRPVQLTPMATVLSVIMISVLVGAMAVGVFGVWPRMERQKLREDLLRSESVPAVGTITRMWTTKDKSSTTYHAVYAYDVLHKHYQAEAQVTKRAYSFLGVEHSVSLRYAASRPDLSLIEGEIVTPAWLVLLVFVPLIGVGIAMTTVVLRQKKLLETGQAAGAIVTRSSPTKGGRQVTYQFLDSDGNAVSGSVTVKSSAAPDVGKAVTILYDPSNSKRSLLYPSQYVRIRASYGGQ